MLELSGEQVNPLAVVHDHANNYISAKYPSLYLSEDGISRFRKAGLILGVSLAGVGDIDLLATAIGKSNNPTDKLRNESRERMEDEITDIAGSLSRHPDQVAVCRDIDYSSGECVKTETYNVSSQDGVVRFSRDEINSSDLPGAEKTVLAASLPTESTGARDATFDEQIVNGLKTSAETYASSRPDQARPTTNAHTGELIATGTTLVLAVGAIAAWLKSRHGKQQARLNSAHKQLWSDEKFSDRREEPRIPYYTLDILRGAAGFSQYENPGKILSSGGPKARQSFYDKVQKVVDSAAVSDKSKAS